MGTGTGRMHILKLEVELVLTRYGISMIIFRHSMIESHCSSRPAKSSDRFPRKRVTIPFFCMAIYQLT